MAFKLVFCIAAMAIACAQAKPGGPAAYSISAPSVDHASVGNTQEHTVKGHYGQSSQSDYASQVQTAHSQSHVQRSSISNDGGLAPAHGYAVAPQAAGYAIGHTAPAAQIQLASSSSAYAAPTFSYGGHYAAAAAPTLAYGGHYAATAPALQLSGAASHGFGLGYAGYAAAPALSHGYLAAAPAPAPVVKYAAAAAPAYAPSLIGHGIGLAAPAAYAAPAYAAPAYTTHLAAAPVLKAAVAAPALVHTSVSGHGIHYGY
ncbi:cuticle protein 16.5 isoform X1 [Drosophila sulfurigaster albostrigata]|uniref:Cuticle protein 16.5 isoform X1 n=1 Tax=Drosophila albomicans TaxID=7291 RepID=A0A9C6SSD7_DROAB|nr:cuticle protein 16.5 isoform X1 [Drosophila albomicans]XP_060662858.1 cuticle protein 16.5 isoform X1 [Drosophila nasuta]XP_062140842.1 cuticle protein 16.5 isoform X1 [Drosophila sulfurigaster albostrigata]